ncbi:hypothetical protein TSUD_384470 [Trifolium subterraneum]|uniref:Protein kinase domain-containing protein n=1 Tax=Trifolium subterraneum TaxID=3900 RepID=A0A2Z6NFS2_TRISU|nr:hypothetical protein TSUD_384470 [Trifolium subterraneum]
MKSFTFSELKTATRNFRPGSVVGEGGFGAVFKGWIDEHSLVPVRPGTGVVIAVKKLNQEGLQGHSEWLVITGATNIRLRRGKMRWKAEIKRYNFHNDGRWKGKKNWSKSRATGDGGGKFKRDCPRRGGGGNLSAQIVWNNTQHQPGEAVIRILRLGLERRNLGLRWSLLLVRLEEDKQSTIALGYLGDREESDIVGPKKGLKSVWWSLWNCPKIPRTIGGKHLFESMERFTPGFEEEFGVADAAIARGAGRAARGAIAVPILDFASAWLRGAQKFGTSVELGNCLILVTLVVNFIVIKVSMDSGTEKVALPPDCRPILQSTKRNSTNITIIVWEEVLSSQLQFMEKSREHYFARAIMVLQYSVNIVVANEGPYQAIRRQCCRLRMIRFLLFIASYSYHVVRIPSVMTAMEGMSSSLTLCSGQSILLYETGFRFPRSDKTFDDSKETKTTLCHGFDCRGAASGLKPPLLLQPRSARTWRELPGTFSLHPSSARLWREQPELSDLLSLLARSARL